MTQEAKAKKKRGFPSAFTVLFIIMLLAAVLTYVVPAGSFERLLYTPETQTFTLTDVNGGTKEVPATQKTLDKYHITVPLENFKNGSVKKPVAIPDSYKKIKQRPQGLLAVLSAPVTGLTGSIDIIGFVLILGGNIAILNETGAFAAGISSLSRKTKGHEFFLIVLVSLLVTAGGTTFGMAEECIAFYPILMPIFLAAGYDAIVGISALFLSSAIGTMFSTTNPFSVVIASNAAGISFSTGLGFRLVSLFIAELITLLYIHRYAKKVKADPSKSIVADMMPEIKDHFLKDYNPELEIPFDWRRILMLTIFAAGFPVLIWGVSVGGWWFEQLTTLFLGIGLINMFLSNLGEKKAISVFIEGAASLVGVGLIIAVARGTNIIMDSGAISDTILNAASGLISNVNGVMFSSVQMILFSFLGIFIPSSSGLATLSMPIVAPLADVVNVGREVVVSAYNQGQGWMAFIAPTGLIMVTLELVGVTYDRWFKFVWPLMAIIGIFALVMLGLMVVI